MRVSELVGLDLQHIDLNINGLLVTRKGGNQAILYFPDEVADVLRAYLPYRRNLQAMPGHENALFLSLQKKRISVDAIENMVKKYARIAAPLKRKISQRANSGGFLARTCITKRATFTSWPTCWAMPTSTPRAGTMPI